MLNRAIIALIFLLAACAEVDQLVGDPGSTEVETFLPLDIGTFKGYYDIHFREIDENGQIEELNYSSVFGSVFFSQPVSSNKQVCISGYGIEKSAIMAITANTALIDNGSLSHPDLITFATNRIILAEHDDWMYYLQRLTDQTKPDAQAVLFNLDFSANPVANCDWAWQFVAEELESPWKCTRSLDKESMTCRNPVGFFQVAILTDDLLTPGFLASWKGKITTCSEKYRCINEVTATVDLPDANGFQIGEEYSGFASIEVSATHSGVPLYCSYDTPVTVEAIANIDDQNDCDNAPIGSSTAMELWSGNEISP